MPPDYLIRVTKEAEAEFETRNIGAPGVELLRKGLSITESSFTLDLNQLLHSLDPELRLRSLDHSWDYRKPSKRPEWKPETPEQWKNYWDTLSSRERGMITRAMNVISGYRGNPALKDLLGQNLHLDLKNARGISSTVAEIIQKGFQ